MTWEQFARRSHAPLSMRLLQEAQRAPYFSVATGIEVGLANHVWIDDVIYIPTGEQDALEGAVRGQLGDDWGFLDRFCRRCRSALDGLAAEAEAFGDRWATAPEEAVRLWLDAYRAAMAFVPVFRILDRVLAEQVSAEEASTYLNETRQGDTAEARERAELASIVDELRAIGDRTASSPTADRLLVAHADAFGWLRMRWYLGRPFTTDDFRDRAAALLALPPRHHADYCEAVPAPTSAREAMLAELAHLRTQRAEVINEAIWRAAPLLEQVARSMGIEYDDLVHLLPDEVVAGVTGGSVDPAVARRRRTGFASALLDDEFSAYAGPSEVEALVGRLGLERPRPSGEADGTNLTLHGVTASPGRATGLVRIVRTADDADSLQAGEILVTTMTYPSMIGAMQRSAAIVTDDGGLLSHAAITAREIRKPCVIGAGSATTHLRTGDLVHVDAGQATITRPAPTRSDGTP